MKGFTKGMQLREKGFTIIELLIVIAILGIIAAVVIPNIGGFMTSGQLAAANSEAENVKTASLAFCSEYGVWPVSSANLTPTFISGELKADYTFDTDYGWVINATANEPDGWSGIEFTGAVEGANGRHGQWKR